MTADRDPSNGQPVEQPFLNSPGVAIDNFLTPNNRIDANVLTIAGQLVRDGYKGFDGRMNTLGICILFANRLSDSTTVLAELFATDSTDLPEHWKNNPEVTRTVLSMSGHVELGFLRALQVAQAHQGGNPSIDARIAVVERFVTDLQAK